VHEFSDNSGGDYRSIVSCLPRYHLCRSHMALQVNNRNNDDNDDDVIFNLSEPE